MPVDVMPVDVLCARVTLEVWATHSMITGCHRLYALLSAVCFCHQAPLIRRLCVDMRHMKTVCQQITTSFGQVGRFPAGKTTSKTTGLHRVCTDCIARQHKNCVGSPLAAALVFVPAPWAFAAAAPLVSAAAVPLAAGQAFELHQHTNTSSTGTGAQNTIQV